VVFFTEQTEGVFLPALRGHVAGFFWVPSGHGVVQSAVFPVAGQVADAAQDVEATVMVSTARSRGKQSRFMSSFPFSVSALNVVIMSWV